MFFFFFYWGLGPQGDLGAWDGCNHMTTERKSVFFFSQKTKTRSECMNGER